MFCTNCGKEISDEAVVCTGCGVPVKQTKKTQVNPNDSRSTGWAVLGFFFPVIGLILWAVWNNEFPLRSKSIAKGAIIGVIAEVVLSIIMFVAMFALISSGIIDLSQLPYYGGASM
ncbi:MAG: zinc ribbon domain-containing protein [Clostridia bacterium]